MLAHIISSATTHFGIQSHAYSPLDLICAAGYSFHACFFIFYHTLFYVLIAFP